MPNPQVAQSLDLARLLNCPKCRSSLLEIHKDESLVCQSCRATFPSIAGVPRLAANPYVASFGRQWNRYDVERPEEDTDVFLAKTGLSAASLRGKLVLDAGCGGGRYSKLLGTHGAKVLGLDLSDAVEKAARSCCNLANVGIIQADLLDIPLAPRTFDFAFSIGVLHHSPDPRRAFTQVADKVKPGGQLAVWLYRRNTWPQELVNSSLRAITTHVPPALLETSCAGLGILGSIPVLKQTLNKVVNFSNHPDWTLRICDNFDWYAPTYQSHHTVDELMRWFQEEGFTNLRELAPLKSGSYYSWAYRNNLIIGSGVNVLGTKGD